MIVAFGCVTMVVLGFGLIDGHRVGPLLAPRFDRAVDLARPSPQRTIPAHLVCFGGRGTDERLAEADAMADYLYDHAVPRDRVSVENRSADTAQNLAYSRTLIDELALPEPVAVVTSEFPAFRAATLMRKVGIAGDCVGARTARFYVPSATIREFVAVVRDNLAINVLVPVLLLTPWIGTAEYLVH